MSAALNTTKPVMMISSFNGEALGILTLQFAHHALNHIISAFAKTLDQNAGKRTGNGSSVQRSP